MITLAHQTEFVCVCVCVSETLEMISAPYNLLKIINNNNIGF